MLQLHTQSLAGKRVAVVGAGIQGLLVAVESCRAGAKVVLYSAGADPRPAIDSSRSSTSGGESGRFITILEGHPYLGDSAMYPNMGRAFERPVSRGGWLGSEPASLPPDQVNWLSSRAEAGKDTAAIARTFAWYIQTTRRAMGLWREMFADWRPLFEGTQLHSDSVLRLYDSAAVVDNAAETHATLGVLKEVLSQSQVAGQAACFSKACELGTIAGGLRVEGYALDIRRFVTNILNWLQSQAVEMHWNAECTAAVTDSSERVTGLRFSGHVERADHYVVAPGAYCGGPFLEQFGLEISGVAGRWILVPRPPGFVWPVKAHLSARVDAGRQRPVVDLNLTPYYDGARQCEYLAIGGGYIHVGGYPFAFDPAEMALADAEIERAVGLLMPDWFAEADRASRVVRSKAMCVRSFTVDDRPAVALCGTGTNGLFVLHAGLNTGTTAMAPAIAQSAVKLLASGSESSLQELRPHFGTDDDLRIPGYIANSRRN